MQQHCEEFLDIYDFSWQPLVPLWWWVAGASGLILMIGTGIWLLHRKKQSPPLSYWQQALADLAKLLQEYDKDKITVERLYVRLTAIFKAYLQQRYAVAVADKTDFELRAVVKKLSLADMSEHLIPLLSRAQLVKFAQADLLVTQVRQDIQLIQQVIEKTSPRDEQHNAL